MSSTELTALLLFCTAMSFSPGPNTTLSTALAANRGLRRALTFCFAVPTGWTLLMVASGLGLGALVLGAPILRLAVKIVGVAYLLWLALQLIGVRVEFSAATGTPRINLALTPIVGDRQQGQAARLEITFWQGVALQFVNIKAWMMALTLTAGWVVNAAGAPASNPGQRLAIICGVMVLFAFTSNFVYALAGSLLRGWLATGRRLVWFNRGLAAVLVATACWMATV